MTRVCPNCGHALTPPPAAPRELLTPRELEILSLCAGGWNSHHIASQLSLSWETVRWHLKSTYRRLGVHTRADAIARARELGLIETPTTEETT